MRKSFDVLGWIVVFGMSEVLMLIVIAALPLVLISGVVLKVRRVRGAK